MPYADAEHHPERISGFTRQQRMAAEAREEVCGKPGHDTPRESVPRYDRQWACGRVQRSHEQPEEHRDTGEAGLCQDLEKIVVGVLVACDWKQLEEPRR